MAIQTAIKDGVTWRTLDKFAANDSGTWRRCSIHVNDGGTWRLAHSAFDSFSMTAGEVPDPFNPPSFLLRGYDKSNIGSVSPSGFLRDGKEVSALTDEPTASNLKITGFSSNPGTGYLISVTANSVTRLASAASYSYSSGTATWRWSSQTFGFANGGNYSASILRA